MGDAMRRPYLGAIMRKGLWACVIVGGAVAVAACNDYNTGPVQTVNLGNPDSLMYVLLPGAPAAPEGVMLTWVAATDPNVSFYIVYGRTNSSASWGQVAETPGTEYFDVSPLGQYYVASADESGDISSGSDTVTVDTLPPMGAPSGLAGTPLDSGVALTWSDSVRLANQSIFNYYRVYSEQPSGSPSSCPTAGAGFGLEGTTVSEDFVVTGIANGTAVCYGVTTVSQEGQESTLSPWIMVTPSSSGGSFDIVAHPGATVVVHRARKGRTWQVMGK
jgi:hypothetical protein